jgi:hypothetical protein
LTFLQLQPDSLFISYRGSTKGHELLCIVMIDLLGLAFAGFSSGEDISGRCRLQGLPKKVAIGMQENMCSLRMI